MKIFKDFIAIDFLEEISAQNKENIHNDVWRTNKSWNPKIVKSSATVLIRHLDKECTNYLKNHLLTHNLLDKNDTVFAMSYLWQPLSYIPWHKDSKRKGAATIYLNKKWDIDWGGYLMWKKNDEIKSLVPEFNNAAINDSNVDHSTTLTTLDAPARETIQIFWV